MNRHSCIAMLLLILGSVAHAQVAEPSADQLRSDYQQLDALQKVFATTPQFGDAFWHTSIKLADQRGPDILYALFERAQHWQGEQQGLIFSPMVALLPREKTTKLLHEYQHSKRPADRLWAGEFLADFGMSDTKAGIAHYRKEAH